MAEEEWAAALARSRPAFTAAHFWSGSVGRRRLLGARRGRCVPLAYGCFRFQSQPAGFEAQASGSWLPLGIGAVLLRCCIGDEWGLGRFAGCSRPPFGAKCAVSLLLTLAACFSQQPSRS